MEQEVNQVTPFNIDAQWTDMQLRMKALENALKQPLSVAETVRVANIYFHWMKTGKPE